MMGAFWSLIKQLINSLYNDAWMYAVYRLVLWKIHHGLLLIPEWGFDSNVFPIFTVKWNPMLSNCWIFSIPGPAATLPNNTREKSKQINKQLVESLHMTFTQYDHLPVSLGYPHIFTLGSSCCVWVFGLSLESQDFAREFLCSCVGTGVINKLSSVCNSSGTPHTC